jgi:hypothetical protein
VVASVGPVGESRWIVSGCEGLKPVIVPPVRVYGRAVTPPGGAVTVNDGAGAPTTVSGTGVHELFELRFAPSPEYVAYHQ